jgi:hypothetical protein
MGGFKQQLVADQEYYDNLVAWMRVHKPVLSDATFQQIVDNPPLLRATVKGWVESGQPYPPKYVTGGHAYHLPKRRELRERKSSGVWTVWVAFAVLFTGTVYVLIRLMGWG